jgi:hypothetical protein|tara:strand:+ start:64 stop:924 length:861 start_codon:yes stop_codon:yes gene_type:complete
LSRNRDRLGNRTVQHSDPAPQQTQPQQEAGSFSFVVPTEFVELPSKGAFYAEGHPLHNQETIEIKHMTAKEEDMLTSQALLKKGLALERVINSIIVDKRINPDSLLIGDRNAIMVAARISGYGSDYTTKVSCPSCSETQEYSFDLFDAQTHHGESNDDLLVESIGGGLFSTVLPRTKFEVVFRLLDGRDEKTLLTQIDNARKKNKEENAVTRQLKLITVSVNGDDSPQAVNYFVNNVPSIDSHHLRTAFTLATPNIDLSQHFTCNKCGYDAEMEVPLTADFFWPKR